MKTSKKILLALPLVAAVGLSGCAITGGTIEGEIECTIGDECKVKGKVKGNFYSKLQRDMILPLFEMVATASGFSYSDWSGLDVSKYSMSLTGSSASANQATVKVFDYSGGLIGQSNFPINAIGNTYKFSNPATVKTWSNQFIDIGEDVEVSFLAPEAETMSLSVKEDGIIRASASYFRPQDDDNIFFDPQ